MKPRHLRFALIAALLMLCTAATWYFWIQRQPETAGDKPENAIGKIADRNPSLSVKTSLGAKGAAIRQDPNFPINDKIELPFLGKVQCHARQEKVLFTANGKQMEWPFKVYYLPNGMFVRAHFFKAGARDYEFEPKEMEWMYRSWGQFLVGFPERAAPASLGKVLQSLYVNESFDRATKITITYVLLDESELGGKIQPCFIANIWGVSPGLMSGRVPEDDEGFLKYRVFLDQHGVATFSDNRL